MRTVNIHFPREKFCRQAHADKVWYPLQLLSISGKYENVTYAFLLGAQNLDTNSPQTTPFADHLGQKDIHFREV